MRNGIAAMLERERDYVIAACCATVGEAHAALARGVPIDVALIDLRLPDGSGLDVIAAIAAARPPRTSWC